MKTRGKTGTPAATPNPGRSTSERHRESSILPSYGTGATLFNIYHNLFPVGGTDANIRAFQTLAAGIFDGPEARKAFVDFLTRMNGGVDPGLSNEQIESFGYFMKLDQNALAVAPFETPVSQMW